VWAQDAGSDAGEFGLRFTELNDVDEDAIRGTFAEAEEAPPAEPAKARLHLAGMSAPLRARIRTEMDDAIVLGSDLSFLKLGEPIEVERHEGKREKGRVEDVTIEIDDETRVARLMLTVALTGTSKTAKYGAVSAAAKVVAETAATIAQRRGPNATAMLSPVPSDIANVGEVAPPNGHAEQGSDDALDEQIAANADDDEESPAVTSSAPRTPPAWLVSVMATLRAMTTKAGPALARFTRAVVAWMVATYGTLRARIKGTPVEVETPRPSSGRRPQIQQTARAEAQPVVQPKKKLGLYVLAGAGLLAIVFAVATSGKSTHPRTPRPQVAVAPADPAVDPNAALATPAEANDPSNAANANAAATANEAAAVGEPEAGMNGPVAAPTPVAGQNFEGPDDTTGRRARRRTLPTDLMAASHSRNANVDAERPTIRGAGPRVANAPAPVAAPARPAVAANAPVVQVIGSSEVRTGTMLRMRMDGNLTGISGGVGTGNTIVIRMPGRRSLDLAAPLVRQDARLVNAGVYNRASGAELTLRFREAVPQFSARARGNTLEIVLAPASAARRVPVSVAAHRR
jgi:hypothetical protein